MSGFISPLSQLAAEICGEIAQWKVYDCHEHLPTEKQRMAQYLDAFKLFSHYCRDDLRIAGMENENLAFVLDSQGDIDEKWRLFRPYYESIRHTSYARAAHIAMQKFYGADELNAETVHTVTESMRRQNKPGLYDRILRGACGIITSLNNVGSMNDTGDEHFRRVLAVPDLTGWDNVMGVLCGRDETPEALESALQEMVSDAARQGAAGMKFFPAHYSNASKEDAQKVFEELRSDRGKRLGRSNPLNDWFAVRTMRFTHEAGLVCAMHTGYWKDFRELAPSNLLTVLEKNLDIKFDIFHLGYPYVREAVMLGKFYTNVRLNMCWTYLISPKFAFEALDEMTEMLPDNRIIGFGGDYLFVEKVYGHLVMARETIAKVMAKKIEEGVFTKAKALDYAHKMLVENPKYFYKL